MHRQGLIPGAVEYHEASDRLSVWQDGREHLVPRVGVPLRVYDAKLDDFREPTQRDLDCFMALGRAYGEIRSAYHQDLLLRPVIEAAHAELMASINPAWHDPRDNSDTR